MVATRGPIPKRSEDRVRGNVADYAGLTKGTMKPVRKPTPNPKWHPIAKRIYSSLESSGQSDFYQNSDWAFAYSLCDDLSNFKLEEDARHSQLAIRAYWDTLTPAEREAEGLPKTTAPPVSKGGSAMKMSAIYSEFARLMVTEADRRRMRIELQEPSEEGDDATVTVMSKYRAGLMKGAKPNA